MSLIRISILHDDGFEFTDFLIFILDIHKGKCMEDNRVFDEGFCFLFAISGPIAITVSCALFVFLS